MLMEWTVQCAVMSIVPILIYRFNTILTKITTRTLVEGDKFIQKFMWTFI